MTTRTLRLVLGFVLALGASPTLAEHEDASGHAKHPSQTIVLDGNDVRPSTTRMNQSDVIAFQNYSTIPVQVTFTEPADLEKMIRCGLVTEKAETPPPSAPWALFEWRGGKLTATIPPGRFASVCSLEPGTYSFTATPVAHDPRPSGVLPAKGQVVVK